MTPNPNPSPELHIAIFWSDEAESVLIINDDVVSGSVKPGVTYKATSIDVPAAALSPQTLPAPGEVELAGHVRGIAQVIRAFPNDEAWGGPDMAQQAAAILDRAVETLATVAAANDEGVARAAFYAESTVAVQRQESDQVVTVEGFIRALAAIRLLPQGGGR